MKKYKLFDKEFEISIPAATIQDAVSRIAEKINRDLSGKEVVFLCVLNGSFMFAADLLKKIILKSQITFVKVASYDGTESTGTMKELIGLNENLNGRAVVIVEDIIDTGVTLSHLVDIVQRKNPSVIKIASLLLKPEKYNKQLYVDYVGLEVPNDFIIGYGLDYNGYGRNLEDIYKLAAPEAKTEKTKK